MPVDLDLQGLSDVEARCEPGRIAVVTQADMLEGLPVDGEGALAPGELDPEEVPVALALVLRFGWGWPAWEGEAARALESFVLLGGKGEVNGQNPG